MKMNKIGIISGDGNLPLYIGKALSDKKFQITYFLMNSSKNEKNYVNKNYINIEILSIKKLIDTLKVNNIKKIILAGSIRRPSLKDVAFDMETLKLAKNLLLEKKGDNNLLISIKKYLENKGFSFFNWTKYCPELFSREKNLTSIKPSKIAYQNFLKAKSIYKYYKNIDVGQSMIIQSQLVLGLEAIEGTDTLMERCFDYKRKGDKGILVKFAKKNQSELIDIPLIGLDTIINIKKYNYEGIFLQLDKCLIIDKAKIIKFADNNKIFISSMDLG